MAFNSALISAAALCVSLVLVCWYMCLLLSISHGHRRKMYNCFLTRKTEKHMFKSGLYNEGGTPLLFFFINFKTSWKNDQKKKTEKIQHIMTRNQRLCLCPLPAGITGYNHLSWWNNFEEKNFNPFSYTLNQQTFLFVMVEVKTDFLSKNPFSVFCKCSGITHLKWLVYFQWFLLAV